ncbi:hypothetical protein JKP88DRAFT_253619 [Tribonema minus]|uniref:Uncharacterized protein n=1 Tax=Tribonema minus TaxID=303371 RepID=A0A835Z5X1_9STRA|nr:hypothetical protein JKP88DRAFT_253619 [Tribonema minus]
MPPVSKVDEMMARPGDIPLCAVGQPVEADVSAIGPEIQSFQDALCTFADSFAGLFSTQDNHHEDVTMLRSLIITYAMLYQQLQLRMSKAFIANLKDFLSNYLELDAELFQENVEYIVEAAKEYCEQAELVKSLHLTLYDDINSLAQDAAVSLQKLELEAKQGAAGRGQGSKERFSPRRRFARWRSSRHKRRNCFGGFSGSRQHYMHLHNGYSRCSSATGSCNSGCLWSHGRVGRPLLQEEAGGFIKRRTYIRFRRYTPVALAFSAMQVAARTTRIAANENFKNAKLAAETISGTVLTCINDFTNANQKATQYFCRVATSAVEFHEGTMKADAASKTPNMSRGLPCPSPDDCITTPPQTAGHAGSCPSRLNDSRINDTNDWLAAKDQELQLSRAIGETTGWKLLEGTCPAVKVPEEVYTEIVMDNTHGTGVMTKIVTMEQVLATHADSSASETYTDEHNTTTKLGMEANIRIVPGVRLQPSAAAAFENKLKHSNTHSNGTSNQSSNKMSEAVTLVAAAGTAAKYRLTVRDNGDFITKAVPM